MTKPTYSIDVPDQPRLKIARTEIEAVLRKHDLAGVVVLHTPGMAEFFYDIRPSYSVAWVDEPASILRVKSKNADYDGDAAALQHDRAATANMAASLADSLGHAATMFAGIKRVIDHAFGATHTDPGFVADPHEGRRQ